MLTSNRGSTVRLRLAELERDPPPSWIRTGPDARPNLHALLRYPAMMVPRMQGDILDAIIPGVGADRHVLDPFVGSGTVMTESTVRSLDFVGVDINPLAVMVCEAKAAIDAGTDVDGATETVVAALRSDVCETIDAEFPNRSKWFTDETAVCLSRIRRAICEVADQAARKVMWTVFAETIRTSSNSRTSTYKLHIRPEGDRVDAVATADNFAAALRQTLARVREYRASPAVSERTITPAVRLACGDSRHMRMGGQTQGHQIMVTSPPYGDNQTTIPYGQFSYLALRLIPTKDLPVGYTHSMVETTHSLDNASLGGNLKVADLKVEALRGAAPPVPRCAAAVPAADKTRAARKMTAFLSDFLDALSHIRAGHPGVAHWAVTTGNRTAAGMVVPFDRICRDFVTSLGGVPVAVLQRRLPAKRMPSRNSMGTMITVESTLVAEFA